MSFHILSQNVPNKLSFDMSADDVQEEEFCKTNFASGVMQTIPVEL